MSRFAPLAVILLSLALCACQSTASNSAPGANASLTGAPAPASAVAGTGTSHTKAISIFFLTVATVGYVLLQIYAGGRLTGHRRAAAGFFGHLFTGGTVIVVRLMDNVVRFVASEFTGTSQGSVSLITGNPNPSVIYDPLRPEPAPATAPRTLVPSSSSQAQALGLGLSTRGVGPMSMMQDIPSSSGPVLEKHVAVGSNGNS
jgi:hypothetical protein